MPAIRLAITERQTQQRLGIFDRSIFERVANAARRTVHIPGPQILELGPGTERGLALRIIEEETETSVDKLRRLCRVEYGF